MDARAGTSPESKTKSLYLSLFSSIPIIPMEITSLVALTPTLPHTPQGLSSYMINTANIHLDPLSILSSLVPVGLLEEQYVEVRERSTEDVQCIQHSPSLPPLTPLCAPTHSSSSSLQIGKLRELVGRAKGDASGATAQREATALTLAEERSVGSCPSNIIFRSQQPDPGQGWPRSSGHRRRGGGGDWEGRSQGNARWVSVHC